VITDDEGRTFYCHYDQVTIVEVEPEDPNPTPEIVNVYQALLDSGFSVSQTDDDWELAVLNPKSGEVVTVRVFDDYFACSTTGHYWTRLYSYGDLVRRLHQLFSWSGE